MTISGELPDFAFGPRPQRLRLRKSSLLVLGLAALWFTAHGGLYRLPFLNTPVWLAAYLACVCWMLTHRSAARRMLARGWPILLLPGLAMLSAAWSLVPARSLYAGFQFLMTALIALCIREKFDTKQVFAALLVSQAAGFALSYLNMAAGFFPPVYEVNGAFLGIYSHKTLVGRAALWGAFAVVALCMCWRKSMLWGLLAVAVSFPTTLLAHSTNGKLGYLVILLLIALHASRRMPRKIRAFLLFAPAAGVAVLLGIFAVTGADILGETLDALGKNRTLTGRSLLWAIGLDVWTGDWIAGVGFQAFWTSPKYAHTVAWIWAYVDDGLGGFHSAYVEAAVGLGLAGLIVLAGFVVWTTKTLAAANLTRPTPENAVWLAAFVMVAGLAAMEDSFFRMHSAHFMIAAMAFSSARARPHQHGG